MEEVLYAYLLSVKTAYATAELPWLWPCTAKSLRKNNTAKPKV